MFDDVFFNHTVVAAPSQSWEELLPFSAAPYTTQGCMDEHMRKVEREKRTVKSAHRPVQSCSHQQDGKTHIGNDPVDLS